MEMIPVESSNVIAIGYEDGVLAVEFKGGAVYLYSGVSPEHFASLEAAESKGRYLRSHIIPTHKATKVPKEAMVGHDISATNPEIKTSGNIFVSGVVGFSEPQLAIGRIVHYKLEAGRNRGELRPAIVVRVWNPTCCQLQVFTDDTNDDLPCPYWATSRVQGDAEGQWQWPQMQAVKIPVTTENLAERPPGPPDYPRVPNHHPFA